MMAPKHPQARAYIILAFRKCPMFEQASETHSTDVLFLALFTSIGEINLVTFWDQNYLSPGPVPLSGPNLFESQSRPAFGTKII